MIQRIYKFKSYFLKKCIVFLQSGIRQLTSVLTLSIKHCVVRNNKSKKTFIWVKIFIHIYTHACACAHLYTFMHTHTNTHITLRTLRVIKNVNQCLNTEHFAKWYFVERYGVHIPVVLPLRPQITIFGV